MRHNIKQTLMILTLLPIFIQTSSTSCENLICVSQSFKDLLNKLETCQPNYPWSDEFLQLSEYLNEGPYIIEEEIIQKLLDECIEALDIITQEDLEIMEVLLQIKDDIHKIELDVVQDSIVLPSTHYQNSEEPSSPLEPTDNSECHITRSRGCCNCWGNLQRARTNRNARGAQKQLSTYGNFYALMSSDTTTYPDNTAPVAQYAAVEFPRTSFTSGITNDTTEFELPVPGIYEITWQVPVDQEGELELWLDQGSGATGLAYTVVGRRTGNTQIVGDTLIQTTRTNSKVSVRNPNPEALIIPPYERSGEPSAGLPISASITIKRIS
jgi:hypothetical protein